MVFLAETKLTRVKKWHVAIVRRSHVMRVRRRHVDVQHILRQSRTNEEGAPSTSDLLYKGSSVVCLKTIIHNTSSA